MKVKQTPADFRVEELTDVVTSAGEFAFYRLHKVGWTTPDALEVIRRRWDIELRRVNYGGLKDRHADTVQYLSIYRGPRRNLDLERLTLTYIGQILDPYGSREIRANRFGLTLRSLSPQDEAIAVRALGEVEATGLANYFDDQRFGSVGADGQFVGREMVFGRFEAALKLALAAPYEFDRSEQKHEKETLRKHWGDWPTCKAQLPRGHARSLVDYLVSHPTDFKGTIARLRADLGGIYLSAYQSHLWNRLLARWLTATFPADALGTLNLQLGPHPTPTRIPNEVDELWSTTALPLPTARLKPTEKDAWLPHLEAVLAEEGLTLKQMKLPGLDRPFFSKGDRAVCIRPMGLMWTPADDDMNRGRRKLILKFELPRGCYATMLVKRITAF